MAGMGVPAATWRPQRDSCTFKWFAGYLVMSAIGMVVGIWLFKSVFA